MDISVFDLFKIGIGPSSSHTVGPMRAARKALEDLPQLNRVARVKVLLYGSLALTGRGHGTDKAIVLGLSGLRPDTVDPEAIPGLLDAVERRGEISLLGKHTVPFSVKEDIEFRNREARPFHANALRVRAAPVDALQQHGQLSLAERHGAARCLRPDEPAMLQSLGQQTQAIAGPPEQFDDVAAPATEDEDVAAEGILFQRGLDPGRQTVEAATHEQLRAALSTYNFSGDIGKVLVPALSAALLAVHDWYTVTVLMGTIGLGATLAIWFAVPHDVNQATVATDVSRALLGRLPPPSQRKMPAVSSIR